MVNFEISKESTELVNELINTGWQFMLHYGDHTVWGSHEGISWEADFTKQLDSGLYDNHESGYDINPDQAIKIAYQNIKKGKRLNRRNNG